MCSVCGCGGHDHGHDHHHHHAADDGTLAFAGGSGADDGGRLVQIERDVLDHNNSHAAANRARLDAAGSLALNLVSSPGAGKTTLLVRTLGDLAGRHPTAVVEGDQQTGRDADRIRETGAPALQVTTGKGCHLDAHMVGHALDHLGVPENGVVFLENVGNLVCPAAFDLGEGARVVIVSVTEGEDKPLKYPDIFANADLMVLNKVDLLPHLDFDADQCEAWARQVNPDLRCLRLSATTGEGLDAWYAWIDARRPAPAEAPALAEAP